MAIPPQYDEIHQLALAMVDASERGDTRAQWTTYAELKKLCRGQTHPFCWETLGDFTSDDNAALEIYSKAFQFARNMDLPEYLASVQLAMAERLRNLGECNQAIERARAADAIARKGDDMELRQAISEFLVESCSNVE